MPTKPDASRAQAQAAMTLSWLCSQQVADHGLQQLVAFAAAWSGGLQAVHTIIVRPLVTNSLGPSESAAQVAHCVQKPVADRKCEWGAGEGSAPPRPAAVSLGSAGEQRITEELQVGLRSPDDSTSDLDRRRQVWLSAVAAVD